MSALTPPAALHCSLAPRSQLRRRRGRRPCLPPNAQVSARRGVWLLACDPAMSVPECISRTVAAAQLASPPPRAPPRGRAGDERKRGQAAAGDALRGAGRSLHAGAGRACACAPGCGSASRAWPCCVARLAVQCWHAASRHGCASPMLPQPLFARLHALLLGRFAPPVPSRADMEDLLARAGAQVRDVPPAVAALLMRPVCSWWTAAQSCCGCASKARSASWCRAVPCRVRVGGGRCGWACSARAHAAATQMSARRLLRWWRRAWRSCPMSGC